QHEDSIAPLSKNIDRPTERTPLVRALWIDPGKALLPNAPLDPGNRLVVETDVGGRQALAEVLYGVGTGVLHGPRRDVASTEISLLQMVRPATEGRVLLDHNADARRDLFVVARNPRAE